VYQKIKLEISLSVDFIQKEYYLLVGTASYSRRRQLTDCCVMFSKETTKNIRFLTHADAN